jgi:DNA-binding NtrC family response regulator
MRYSFLLIGDREESPSFYTLCKALTGLGELQVLPEKEAMEQIAHSKYDMLIIDAGILDREMALISRVLTEQPYSRVVVLTASPTWRRAKEALQTGAMDYLSKTLSEKEYIDRFKYILAIKPRPQP